MRMKITGLLGALAISLATTQAPAGEIMIDFEIGNSVSNNFAYSLIHTATSDQGNGSVLYRIIGNFSATYDDVANTLTFTSFTADLYDGISVSNPSQLGSLVGSLSLDSGLLNYNPFTNIIDGQLNLDMTLGSSSELITFQFQPIQYNGFANTFDPTSLFLGLWGATPDVFGGTWDGSHLGMDLVGNGVIVPLPAAFMLGLVGLSMAGLYRKRSLNV